LAKTRLNESFVLPRGRSRAAGEGGRLIQVPKFQCRFLFPLNLC
jgi:hypothetical protein